jgi:hypothetical protein
VGDIELQRIETALDNLHAKLQSKSGRPVQAILSNPPNWFSAEAPGQN